jgi:serine/threonine protein kinase
MGLYDFKIIKILGKGKYGEVFLVKKKKTGIKYALKKIYI